MRPLVVGTLALVLVSAPGAACVEPGQYGGPIPVDTIGVEARLARMCSLAPQSMCAALAQPDEDADAGLADGSAPE